jgi:cephalosporin-C deacetylase-like acetyl esterase
MPAVGHRHIATHCHTGPTAATPDATPDPYETYTIAHLRSREYGGGQLEIVERVGANSAFTRYLVKYLSEGLEIHGFMNVPRDEGPHPVIIALHGYIDPGIGDTSITPRTTPMPWPARGTWWCIRTCGATRRLTAGITCSVWAWHWTC